MAMSGAPFYNFPVWSTKILSPDFKNYGGHLNSHCSKVITKIRIWHLLCFSLMALGKTLHLCASLCFSLEPWGIYFLSAVPGFEDMHNKHDLLTLYTSLFSHYKNCIRNESPEKSNNLLMF